MRSANALSTAPRETVHNLLSRWELHANTLRSFGASGQAEAVQRCMMELQDALKAQDDELLSLQQAAQICGYTADHLGRLVRQGLLQNLGRRRAPRVRQADLPRKAANLPARVFRPHLVGADPRQVARAVVTSRKGER